LWISFREHYTQKVENPGILEKVPAERMAFAELADWYLDLSPATKTLFI
jgi:hypothetical protein